MAKLTTAEKEKLLQVLQARFEKNRERHQGWSWNEVEDRLSRCNEKQLWSLFKMEQSGGEPDVVVFDQNPEQLHFIDCSLESPGGRRSLCYDSAALEARKEHKPKGSATGLAAAMGIDLLSEEQYRQLQQKGAFDQKTSSWVQTPEEIRALGGALFCDRRYDTVFLYHNGAQSYYAARGFRGILSL